VNCNLTKHSSEESLVRINQRVRSSENLEGAVQASRS
jgi:hypothetical protein